MSSLAQEERVAFGDRNQWNAQFDRLIDVMLKRRRRSRNTYDLWGKNVMNDMIGYCGLDCEKCDAYIATMNNDQVLRKKTAKLWAELNNAPILPEHINCEGCRVDGVKTVFCDSLCAIRQCAIKKGVSTCGDCSEVKLCEKAAAVIQNNAEARKNLDL